MKIFILEDDPNRMVIFKRMFKGHTIVHVETSDEGIEVLNTIKFDIIFLDHDLGGRQFVDSREYDTGYRVAVSIPQTINKDTDVVIHSYNPAGAKNMENVLDNRGEGRVRRIPFGSFDENILN